MIMQYYLLKGRVFEPKNVINYSFGLYCQNYPLQRHIAEMKSQTTLLRRGYYSVYVVTGKHIVCRYVFVNRTHFKKVLI